MRANTLSFRELAWIFQSLSSHQSLSETTGRCVEEQEGRENYPTFHLPLCSKWKFAIRSRKLGSVPLRYPS